MTCKYEKAGYCMITQHVCEVLDKEQATCEILEGEDALLEDCGEVLDIGDNHYQYTED